MIYFNSLQTPAYICDETLLEKNLEILSFVKKRSGAKILLALKGFAMWSTFDKISKHLNGCSASGLHEARLAFEHMGKEVHTYSSAFKANEIREIAKISSHLIFNSSNQLFTFKDRALKANPNLSLALRINPECSKSPVALYDPCAINSRFGETFKNFNNTVIPFIDGIHFHALCEQNVDALKYVLKSLEKNFSYVLKQVKYVNFGGGHLITKVDYDVNELISVIKEFKDRYNGVEVYLEPGEAVAWECGYLVSTILDIIDNGMKIAILDVSAEAHMPDTLAMPYRATVRDAKVANESKFTYKLAGNSCLAGDIMGDYSFNEPLKIGDQIIFEDQIHYTFVKNTTFNGLNLPSLMIRKSNGTLKLIRSFSYKDYKMRLS